MRAQFQQEMKKAEERVHTTPDGVVGWVIRLLQTDLENLTPSEWTVLSFEIASFVYDTAGRYGGLVATQSGWAVEAVPQGDVRERLPSRQEGITLQRTLMTQLEAYWETAHAVFTFPQLTLIVTMPGAFDDKKGTVLVAAKQKIKEFEYRFAHLLAEAGQYIRRCPECSKIYLAIRCDQLYCHPRCQARVASRKWREARKAEEKKEKRHGAKRRKG
jgi:hypothetical protein